MAIGANVMSGAYINIHKSWLIQHARDMSQTPRAFHVDIQMGRGYDVATLPKGVQMLFEQQPEIVNHLAQALQVYEVEREFRVSEVKEFQIWNLFIQSCYSCFSL